MEAHLLKRTELIEQERKRGHRADNLSSKEIKANSIIQELRIQEDVTIWQSNDVDSLIFKGMPFSSTSKAVMESSKLFGFIRQMSKGCLLHCHLDAINEPINLLDLALKYSLETLTISSSLPLTTPENLAAAALIFNHSPCDDEIFSEAAGKKIRIYQEDYDNNTPVDVRRARLRCPLGEECFDKLIVSKLIATPESDRWSALSVWAHFQSTFNVSAGLFLHAPVFSEYISQILRLSLEDQIPYLEARINFLPKMMLSLEGTQDCPHREWVQMFQNETEKLKKEDSRFWGAKIIYSTIRVVPVGWAEGQGLRWYLNDCMELKKEFPDVICGFDLVGHEDGLKPLIEYLEDLIWFQEECKTRNLDIPFLFHAGETNSDGGAADMNLYDAILLGTKRIGHGFSITHHPILMEMCRESNIAIESCPISNELLRYTKSVETHPIKILLNNSVPVSISNDDSQFFLNSGLSFDFYSVFNSIDKMTISDLGSLARKSIGYSMMSDLEKKQAEILFDISWIEFLDIVINSSAP